LRQLVPASLYVLFRYELEFDTLTVSHAVGDRMSLTSGLNIKVGEKISGWSAANKRPALNSDAHLDLGALADSFDPPLNCAVSTPILLGDKLLGVLTLYAEKRDAFTRSHAYILEHVATLLAPNLSRQPPRRNLDVLEIRSARR
jgi:GAF domain-containing protein